VPLPIMTRSAGAYKRVVSAVKSTRLRRRPFIPKYHVPGLIERLHEVVRSLGSQSAAAHSTHRSKGTLRKWLWGKSEPTAIDIQRLCETSGYTAEWVIFGTDLWGRCEREHRRRDVPRKLLRRAARGAAPPENPPANLIERLREVIGWFGSTTAAARAIHRSERSVRKWAHGESEPLATDILRMCQASGYTAEWLIRGTDLWAGGYEHNRPAAFSRDKSVIRILPPLRASVSRARKRTSRCHARS
jgi:DNA-binding transcriptional regulator YiaG